MHGKQTFLQSCSALQQVEDTSKYEYMKILDSKEIFVYKNEHYTYATLWCRAEVNYVFHLIFARNELAPP